MCRYCNLPAANLHTKVKKKKMSLHGVSVFETGLLFGPPIPLGYSSFKIKSRFMGEGVRERVQKMRANRGHDQERERRER